MPCPRRPPPRPIPAEIAPRPRVGLAGLSMQLAGADSFHRRSNHDTVSAAHDASRRHRRVRRPDHASHAPHSPGRSDDVLIRVESAGIGVWDPFEREGGFAKMSGARGQVSLVRGSDGAGTVVDVSNVPRFQEGRPRLRVRPDEPQGRLLCGVCRGEREECVARPRQPDGRAGRGRCRSMRSPPFTGWTTCSASSRASRS